MSFDVALFQREREARGVALGALCEWLEETQSTNDDALAAARRGAGHGALFGAEAQTRGRGRRGSAWVSTPGEGLWFSLLLRPRLTPELAPLLALCTGLAVRDAVAPLVQAPVALKWPNDVLADGRKLAGILVESQVSGSHIASVIVGVGVNVAQAEFPEPISGIATSLVRLDARGAGREQLLASVLEQLERRLSQLEAGDAAAIAGALRSHDALRGKRVRVEGLVGLASGIDDSGRLLVRADGGEIVAVQSGHVEVLQSSR
jgi:BirA family biotin operon repressor/biotin-[acetyl-CoA-carboxylase] ligase